VNTSKFYGSGYRYACGSWN